MLHISAIIAYIGAGANAALAVSNYSDHSNYAVINTGFAVICYGCASHLSRLANR
jgi:hypothetical protein